MARRRGEAVGPLPPIPAELRHRPATPEEIASWLDLDEAVPPSDWGFGTGNWRAIRAHRRWLDARHAWADEHGVSYVDTFHPRDPATGRRDWSK